MTSDTDKVIVAYSTSDHLLIDLDGATYTQVHGIAKLIMREYRDVGDCLIVKSSQAAIVHKRHPLYLHITISEFERESYHLIFGDRIGFNRCAKIIEDLASVGVLNEQYVFIRQWRGDMSLRISYKRTVQRVAEPPKIVGYIINIRAHHIDTGIQDYLIALSTFNPEATKALVPSARRCLTRAQSRNHRNPYLQVL